MDENYKLQNTNYKPATNHKLQITKKVVSFGQVLSAFGGEYAEDSCCRGLIYQAQQQVIHFLGLMNQTPTIELLAEGINQLPEGRHGAGGTEHGFLFLNLNLTLNRPVAGRFLVAERDIE